MIRQIHVNECDSTQDLLKEQMKGAVTSDTFLVSCEHQASGRGRGKNIWRSMPSSLCFSLNVLPNKVLSLTAIELSVLVTRYFEADGKKLRLKWPNDLWSPEQKKCGGILIQGSQNLLLAGIGINIFSNDPEYGGVYEKELQFPKKQMAKDLAGFILHNRYQNSRDVIRDWLDRCWHLNQMVIVTEGSERIEGIFQGIGEFGEALICRDGKTERIYNGSLRLSL